MLSFDTLHLAIDAEFPDNTTELITPAVVRDFLHEVINRLAAQATSLPLAPAQATDYTLASTDAGTIVTFQSATDLTLTVPDVLGVGAGTVFNIRNRGTGKVSITGTGSANSVGIESELGLRVAPATTTLLQCLDAATYFLDGGRA